MAHQDKVRELIEKIAKEQKYDDCAISIEAISSGGNNFSSHLFLITLSAPGKDDLHLFAKSAAIGEEMRAVVPSSIYTAEHHFYTDMLKAFRKIEEKYNIKDEDKLVTAKYYGASAEHLHEILVLENLTKRGFEQFDRFQSIDWPYARYSIKQLALLHALSVAFEKEDPAGYENYVTNKTTPNLYDAMRDLWKFEYDKTISAVRDENKERVMKLLEKPGIRTPMLHLMSAQGPVIIHSDYRPGNMLHRKLDDGTTEVVILDYQSLIKGNPVVDLLYFLFLNTDKKFRDQYLEKSFELYHHELSSALRRYNLDPNEIYSRATYEKDLKELMPYMLSACFFGLLFLTTVDSSMGQITEDLSVLKRDLVPNSLYLERVNDLIDDCVAMGAL